MQISSSNYKNALNDQAYLNTSKKTFCQPLFAVFNACGSGHFIVTPGHNSFQSRGNLFILKSSHHNKNLYMC